MRLFIKSLVATALFLSFIQASWADGVLKDQTEKWEIYYDATNNNCFTLYKNIDDNVISLATYFNATYSVNLISTSLAGLKEGMHKAVLISGSEKIPGEINYYKLEKNGVLRFYQPTEFFLNAINNNGLLFVQIDNKNYGPFIVDGIKEAQPKLSYCREKYVHLEQGEGRPIEKIIPLIDKKIVEVKEGLAQPWSTSDVGTIFKFPNYSVVLSSRTRADDTVTLIVDVTEEGFKTESFELPNPEGVTGNIMLSKIVGDYKPAITFTNTTMSGVQVRAISNNNIIDFGEYSNTDGLPVSTSKDGIADIFALPDDRALSLKSSDKITIPVRLYAIKNGKKVDVTNEEYYVSYYQELFENQANECWFKIDEDISSCTGYFASSAVLGVLDPAINAFEDNLISHQMHDKEITYCENNECKTYKSYISAIVDLLPKWGFIDKINIKSQKNADLSLKGLYNKVFTPDDGGDCEELPVSISKIKGYRGGSIFTIGGGEETCAFGNSEMIGNAVRARAVCTVIDASPNYREILVGVNDGRLTQLYGSDVVTYKECKY